MAMNININRIKYTKTMLDIIYSKDLASAKAHYDACRSKSGKAMWWNVIEQIWRNTQKSKNKICRQWHVDRIHKVVVPRIDGIDSGNYVYWIQLIDDQGIIRFDKFGTAEDLVRRFGTIFDEKFTEEHNIVRYRVRGVWDCGDAPFLNEELEAYLKRMAAMTYGIEHYIPKDRFDCRMSGKLVNKWVADFFASVQY